MALDLDKLHKTQASTIERVPEGTYMARFASIIDVGIQPQTDWKTGAETDPKPIVLITWELPTEKIEVKHNDGSTEELPRLISKEYKLSANEKSNLMQLITALKPGIENLSEFLGMDCMVSVGSTSTGKAKVVNVVKAPSGMPIPELSGEPVNFDFDDPQEDLFLKLPSWVQVKIKGAINYNGFADTWTQEEAA